jgi:hypothetical protein
LREILAGVEILSTLELERANIENGIKFNSMHEGYAVMLEEVWETREELDRVERRLKSVWGATRRDEYPEESILMLNQYAKLVATEAIQVIAMSQKFIDSFKSEQNIRVTKESKE